MFITAHWYDLAKDRRVEFNVDYSLDTGTLDINDVRPTGISFFRIGTNVVERRISVQTERGCDLLVKQLFDSGEAYNLTVALARRHGLLPI